MEPDAMNDQILVGGIVFIVVAFLASAAVIDYRKKKKLPFLNDFFPDSGLNQFDHDDLPQASFTEPEDLYAYNRSRLQAWPVNEL